LPFVVAVETAKDEANCVVPEMSRLSVWPPGIANESVVGLVKLPFAALKFRVCVVKAAVE